MSTLDTCTLKPKHGTFYCTAMRGVTRGLTPSRYNMLKANALRARLTLMLHPDIFSSCSIRNILEMINDVFHVIGHDRKSPNT